MFASLSWLKEFVVLPDNLTPTEIGNALTMSTVEVEGIKNQGETYAQMVVGKVVELKSHPDADKLKIAMTDIGGNVVQIVCGGTNLFEGMLVAVALPGARVKWHGEGEEVTLVEAVIRGQKSWGMICASSEIGLGQLFPAGEKEILNLSFTKALPGTPLSDAFEFNDVIIDIENKSLTNRPDLWGQIGLARELAAIFKCPFKEPLLEKIDVNGKTSIKVKIKATNDCYRYLGVVVENVVVGPSPTWLKKRLQAVGLKSINNIVDLTNYVMYETGQPLHAFDFKNISGSQIVVRRATTGEKMVILDDSELKLDETTLVIADAKQPVALAGVMGGKQSSISEQTATVVFEAATFNAITIRQAERKFGLRTESAIRFEKGIEPARAELAIKRALTLLGQLLPDARVGEITDIYKNKVKPLNIKFTLDYLQARLGFPLEAGEIEKILTRLGFIVKYKSNKFSVQVPEYRAQGDVTHPEDIVEEVARIYGYDKFKPDLPTVKLTSPAKQSLRVLTKQLKKMLSGGLGFYEAINYAFTNEKIAGLGYDLNKFVKIKNSLSGEYILLRSSLLPGLLQNIAANERWEKSFYMYEIGRRFRLDRQSNFARGNGLPGYLPWQEYQLVGVMTGEKNEVFFKAKGVLEKICQECHLKNWEFVPTEYKPIFSPEAMQLNVNGKKIGYVFRIADDKLTALGITQSVGVFEIISLEDFVSLLDNSYIYKSLPKYPAVIYDLAVVFPVSVQWQAIAKTVKAASSLVSQVTLFDVYVSEQIGEGKKSIAFTITFTDSTKTLQATEIEKEVQNILNKLQTQHQGFLRNK
jgi:phenylalanyl-tRNA synthetase beta chain